MVGEIFHHFHFRRSAPVHVVGDMVHHFGQTGWNRLGQRADLREAVGYQLQTLHIFIHLRNELVVRIILFQDLCPSHQTGDGRSQLMCSLFRQTYPYFILFGFLRGQQGKNSNNDKYQHNAQLDIRPRRQPLDHHRLVVANINKVI